MSTNIEKMKKKLLSLQESTNKTSGLWKPSGKHQIRIVPYKFNKENPFIELWFHYDFNGKNYLSPKSFGDADPLIELAEKLKAVGDPESYKMSRKLTPKLRVYLPVVVRGEEDQGVRFWGFGKTMYEEVLQIMSDEDYGDIADPISGTDLEVTFQSPEESGTTYGKVSVRAKRKTSKLVDNPALLEKLLNNQKSITEIYKQLPYEELSDILKEWLESENGEEEGSGEEESNEGIVSDSDNDEDEIAKASREFESIIEKTKK